MQQLGITNCITGDGDGSGIYAIQHWTGRGSRQRALGAGGHGGTGWKSGAWTWGSAAPFSPPSPQGSWPSPGKQKSMAWAWVWLS